MNRERAKELLPIIKAYAEGAEVQCQSLAPSGVWHDVDPPAFDDESTYRVKPRPVDVWAVVRCGASQGIASWRSSRVEAEACAKNYDRVLPNFAPHRVVHLAEPEAD